MSNRTAYINCPIAILVDYRINKIRLINITRKDVQLKYAWELKKKKQLRACGWPSITTDVEWASYQIRKIVVYVCAGNAGNVFPTTAG